MPGAGDPDIRYWVAKGGNRGFLLYFVVDDAMGLSCQADPMSCWDAAEVVTQGSWDTRDGLNGQGLLHITFYDTVAPAEVPEPGMLTLLGMGLASIGFTGLHRRLRRPMLA